jgi:hypothetical protein
MGKFFYVRIGVTSDAFQFLVDGSGKFLQINKKRAGLTLSLHGQLFIGMTEHTIFVRSRV